MLVNCGGRVLEKSDIMVWVLGIVSAAALLALWCGLGLYHAQTHLGFGLAVSLGAGLVATALLVARAEVRRRYRTRTVYVSDTHLFNPELGLVPLREGVKLQDALADAMEQLRYSFRTHDFPSDEQFVPRFVVRTAGYKARRGCAVRGFSGRSAAPGPMKAGAAACGTAARQRQWCGEVAMMRSGGSVQFDTPERLRAILQPLHPAAR